jgi:hypothetical protein
MDKKSLYTKQGAVIIWVTYALLGDMSSAPPCPLCHCRSLCEGMARNGSSTDMRNPSSTVQPRAATLSLKLSHKKLSGVVSEGLRDGQVNL